MVLLKNCAVYFCKLDPKKPSARFDKLRPSWECQIRTTDKDVAKDWTEKKLLVRPVLPTDGTPPYWKVNLKKKAVKANGEEASPVEVLHGKTLRPIDPNSIGNGSVAHVRIFQYEYNKKDGSGRGLSSVLMGLQVVKHIKYVPKARDDDFAEDEYEEFDPDDGDEPGGDAAAGDKYD